MTNVKRVQNLWIRLVQSYNYFAHPHKLRPWSTSQQNCHTEICTTIEQVTLYALLIVHFRATHVYVCKWYKISMKEIPQQLENVPSRNNSLPNTRSRCRPLSKRAISLHGAVFLAYLDASLGGALLDPCKHRSTTPARPLNDMLESVGLSIDTHH